MSKIAKVIEVGACTSVEDLLHQSNTDWDVEVLPAVIDTAAGPVQNGGYKAIVRPDTNTALAFVGERYRTNSHRAQLMSLDSFVRNGDIIPVSVSMWDNGAMLAYQFHCPGLDVTVHDCDIVSPLLTLAFGYGSIIADSAFFADFRWLCKNQLGKVAALNKDHRVKHRGDVTGRFGDVLGSRIKELSGELSNRYKAMQGMVSKQLTGKPLSDYFARAMGCSKEEADMTYIMPPEDLRGNAAKVPEILECYLADDVGAPGSVWQAFNAVTRYETHKDGRTPETRQKRMLLGAGDEVARHAWTLAAEIAA